MTRILIADDHETNLYVLQALLEGHGYTVEKALDGAEALVLARRAPPDLMISDLLMPVLDGYAMLRQWRSDERLRPIPFIVYTATYTAPRDQRLAMALGADLFVIKPEEPDVLVEHVREVLARAAAGTLPSATLRPLEEQWLLREYNDVLVHKLEKKALEAERVNRELLGEIAERTHAEQRLRASEERFRATFEQAAVGIAHVAVDGTFLWVNQCLCEMTGHAAEAILGRHFRFLLGAATDPDTVRQLQDAVDAGRACAVEILACRRDGSVFWSALSLNPVHDPTGMLTHFVGVQHDVTDRRRLEDQLRQAQKMEAVGRLAGGVAHDFNNLLTIICGYSDLLLATPQISDTDRAVVKEIGAAGERAATLTRQLLGFSRQTMLQPRVIDLNALVGETGRLLRRLLGEDVAFTTVLASDLAPVKADPGQLDQILMNVAVNARDAMPTGGRLTIETANVTLDAGRAGSIGQGSGAGPHVMLAITDTGIGMTPEVKSRIFEPFFTTKDPDKGTGLGLAVVFGIVQQSGGWIDVSSTPGYGTTFAIYFPIAAGAVSTAPAVGAVRAVVSGSETILLVEDEAGVRALAARILGMHGYRVLSAIDGEDALRIAGSHGGALDLVLTDVVMPKLSGPEVVGQLKARFPGIKVIYMSGYTDDAVVRHGLMKGEVSFIQKPYTPVALAVTVRTVLDGTPA